MLNLHRKIIYKNKLLELTVGFFAGLIFTLVGMGPGLVVVSSLHLIFQYQMKKAIIGSLLLLVPISTFSAILHYTARSNIPLFLIWIILGACIGVFTGSWIRNHISGSYLKKFFCLFLTIILFRHWFHLFDFNSYEHQLVNLPSYGHFFIGFSASLLSSLMGIGGGVLIVSVYYSILNFPSKTVTQISVYVVLLNAWLNSIVSYHDLYWNSILTRITIGGLIGAICGIYLFQWIPEIFLQIIYGLILMIILIKSLKNIIGSG